MRIFTGLLLLLVASSCVPKQEVVLRKINNIIVEVGPDGQPMLRGEAVFFNPNSVRMKLKEIKVTVFLDDKKSAMAEQKLNFSIPANDTFTVPLEVHLSMEKQSLLDTFFGILGGKQHKIRYQGFIRISVHGVSIKVPVDYNDEIRLKI